MVIKNVGFIGLGTMGNPMAHCILRKGYPLVVYDLNKKAMADLTKGGAVGCSSPAASMMHTFQNIAISQGKGQLDFTAILTVFEELTNTKVRI